MHSKLTTSLLVISAVLCEAFLRAQFVSGDSYRYFRAGISLPLHSKDPNYSYSWMVKEIAEMGATDLSIILHLYQSSASSEYPRSHPKMTASDRSIREAIETARSLGMQVMLMPVVLLEKRNPLEWRGKLRPPDFEVWWDHYTHEVVRLAKLCNDSDANMMAVGSELSSLESETDSWADLIEEVRRVFHGRLTYSANWDHYDEIEFWNQLDYMALSGYFELSGSNTPTSRELLQSWISVRTDVLDVRQRLNIQVPLIFSELGYASQDGCASMPWNYKSRNQVDLEEQRMCFQAFIDCWDQCPECQGTYVYEWWGLGGPTDPGYTPRGKPAEKLIRQWFQKIRSRNSALEARVREPMIAK